MSEEQLVELIAMTIYADGYTDYGTCSPEHWKRTSEVQREFMRSAARVAITVMQEYTNAKTI